jgi:hypothetical protein
MRSLSPWICEHNDVCVLELLSLVGIEASRSCCSCGWIWIGVGSKAYTAVHGGWSRDVHRSCCWLMRCVLFLWVSNIQGMMGFLCNIAKGCELPAGEEE